MSSDRDGLLDALTYCSKRVAVMEANIVLAADLLTEWVDPDLSDVEETRLFTATRSFLLNLPVGGRL